MQALRMTKIKAWVGDHPRGIMICRGVRDILSLNRLPIKEGLINSTCIFRSQAVKRTRLERMEFSTSL
jgi:hypothetical protein